MDKVEGVGLTRLPEFDGLRGLLAWWVMLGHVFGLLGDGLLWSLGNGYAVHVFIILSGFVITYLLDEGRERWLPFITRRLFRIYPVFAVLLALSALTLPYQAMGLSAAPLPAGHEQGEAYKTLLSLVQGSFWPYLASHVSLMFGAVPISVLPEADSAFLIPSWSLSLEWQFYLIAPFIVWAAREEKRFGYLLALGGLMAVGLLAPGYKETTGYLPFMMNYFIYGIVCYYMWRERFDQTVRKIVPWLLAFFVLDQAAKGEVGALVWVVMFAGLMGIGPMFLRRWLSNFLNHRVMQYLGRQSYPLYLAHMVVCFLVMYAIQPLAATPWLWSLALAMGTVAGSVALAALLHKYVEAPCLKIGRSVVEKMKDS